MNKGFYAVDTYLVELTTVSTVFKQPPQHQITTSDPQQHNNQHQTFFFLKNQEIEVTTQQRVQQGSRMVPWKENILELDILEVESWFPH